MKTSSFKRQPAGFISFLLVLATGAVLTALMFAAYRRALGAQSVEAQVQLRMDYDEKEEAILRSIVAITPNRAMRAMRSGSAALDVAAPLSWQEIFGESLAFANSGRTISPEMMNSLNITEIRRANTGDTPDILNDPAGTFAAISANPVEPGAVQPTLITPGNTRPLLGSYPPPLTLVDPTPPPGPSAEERDASFPFISEIKQYGAPAQATLNSAAINGGPGGAYGLAVGDHNCAKFNRLRYPDINFGYARPGEAFVAKRNWWAFSMDVGNSRRDATGLRRPRRNFVLSIYEIPSQLSISAPSHMALGSFAGGAAWLDAYNIDGGVSVGQADLTGNRVGSLALRRGMNMAAGSAVGELHAPTPLAPGTPFAPGTREQFRMDPARAIPVALANRRTLGAFFPVSLASESGRAAFIPISRNAAFFDRFNTLDGENDPIELVPPFDHLPTAPALSSTSWNNYSVGAQQCAMRVDVTAVTGPADPTPTALRFQYYMPPGPGGIRTRSEIFLEIGGAERPDLPPGYVRVRGEGETYTLPDGVTADFAYGSPGAYTFNLGKLSGTFTFNDSTFAAISPGTLKSGFVRLNAEGEFVRQPFESGVPVSGQIGIGVYPERIPAYLAWLGAAGPEINNSLAVNVDYTTTGLGTPGARPRIPCHPIPQADPLAPPDPLTDYGVVLKECGNLTGFPHGFSLVTNLRLFVGDNINTVPVAPVDVPAGWIPNPTPGNPLGLFYPPVSFFAPEKRWGAVGIPSTIGLNGQIGSLAKVDRVVDTEADAPVIHPLDSIAVGGGAIAAGAMSVDLRKISHPAGVPPITMMNWLVLLEEVR